AAPQPEAAVFCAASKIDARHISRASQSHPEKFWRRSVVAIDALAPLVALLRFHRQRRDRARFETAQRDRLAGFLAVAVSAVVDAGERLVDLGDQFTLTVARAQFDGAVGFR